MDVHFHRLGYKAGLETLIYHGLGVCVNFGGYLPSILGVCVCGVSVNLGGTLPSFFRALPKTVTCFSSASVNLLR